MIYDTAEYARSRLVETVVRLGDKPIFILSVDDNSIASFYLLEDSKRVCHTHVNDLNIEPVPLGFYNTKNGAIYAARLPQRNDWRQGLRNQSLSLNFTPSGYVFKYTHLLEAIVGVSKPFKEAYEEATGRVKIIAFHRYWAVGGGGSLYHKTKCVGVIDKEGNITWSPKYTYLASRFIEDCSNEVYGSRPAWT